MSLLSNLRLVSNLVLDNSQSWFRQLTAVEMRNIRDRCPLLGISFNPVAPLGVTPAQMAEHRQHLFWGVRHVGLEDEGRSSAWLEGVAARCFAALSEEANQLDEEQLFEVLCVAVPLARTGGPQSAPARDAARAVRDALCSDRFHYTPEQVEDRLRQLLGEPDFRLEDDRAD